ncbi:ABC-type phosphate/phosphonate transport system, periplasmic component [Pleurocapsa sp. PCC 7327]|uniref:phosphate/phosphite/phosphonate ABC transporter substrate-binding protein n=1 Tax=Pleurocapsa sp. PCC 7327 TaxID=118163 RepID=UPI00029FF0C2|nr:phosphate/phosphite/phosphonate ABC transporter substrate-binding protein [Pleurocapsa sp. PCC 7327]AFY78416.1 ABC-type phosphate/phosphonate transport system, periplasmic component [Pleurocapsa sp. PCC 7327]
MSPPSSGQLTIGVISFEESDRSVEQYSELKNYLGSVLKSLVELEPAYNELKAIDQIKRKRWDIVFAPPGLAAIAISQAQYVPLFPTEGALKTRSVIIVLKDNPIENLNQLAGKTIALGQPGSATGYYLPIYNLYGLTLAEVRLAATPKNVLELIANREVAAGAMSLAEFNQYRSKFPGVRFRILHTDSHIVPSGAVLVSSDLDPAQKDQIRETLSKVSPAIASSAGYITNAPPPDYQYLIAVVDRVVPIAERIRQKPAPLYEQK